MSTHRARTILVSAAALGLTAPMYAQERSAVSAGELEAAVTSRPAGDREALRRFLATEQVQKVAVRMGLSLPELNARAESLDQASLDMIAQRTGVGERTLAGGSETIVISTTVIIIALLIIILLVK